jgi:FkbM family methyltransferase
MGALRSRLEQLLRGGGRRLEPLATDRLAIYGAGGCGQRVAALAKANGIDVCAFIDARGDGTPGSDGVRRLSPHSDQTRALAIAGVPVVIGIFNFATDVAPIIQLLRDRGFRQIITYPEFHEQYGTEDDFWLTKRGFYRDHTSDILATFDLFSDATSQQVYYECMADRLNHDLEGLRQPDPTNHYLPPDLPAPRLPMRAIDAGAFDGDTLRIFTAKGLEFDALAAFEPDAGNYSKLCATVTELEPLLGAVAVIPCAVGERTEMLNFSAGGGSGSAIAAEGGTSIQAVALDDILPNFAPTFIKLDIEGAEPAALRGAMKLIRRFRPRLAVCVYHLPAHLWTLPRLMHEIDPAYRLALRYHQWNGFDVVAYAY